MRLWTLDEVGLCMIDMFMTFLIVYSLLLDNVN
jgi:hypothetical protein